ncbi:hypothetical protein N865_20675 [Intrasporangium oryzae NRRL B-24470]|uniref:Uncharacterized protein n=1 Tax=Intrasporangium oryzae NRRL B-24470 TaxID=1386089 RepID=W9G1I1_9MICO|nr:hypothetical protein N865_20675 [Intrasporangium oryzae NRRL B-24470]
MATYCPELGEWSAAQIISVHDRSQDADVLDLDWSGPEPHNVADLGPLSALRLTHHGRYEFAQSHREWVLPRSYKNLGAAPLLTTKGSGTWSTGWSVGLELHWRRRWEAGERDYTEEGPEFRQYEDGEELPPAAAAPEVRALSIYVMQSVDCARIASTFPNLTRLNIWGEMGRLVNASEFNRLQQLRRIDVHEMFGMTAHDLLDPAHLAEMEYISLDCVPAEYAYAMRRAWTPEASKGVYLSISKARTPEWVRENVDNPLRAWDGREGISNRTYKKALTAWKASTRPIREVLQADMSAAERREQLTSLGAAFAESFNEVAGPGHLLMTEERDELLEALHRLVTDAAAVAVDPEEAALTVMRAVNTHRDW